MKKRIIIFPQIFALIFLLLCFLASAEKSFVISLNYIDNNLLYSSTLVTETEYLWQENLNSNSSVELLDKSGNILYHSTFDITKDGPFTLTVPYKRDVKEIVITPASKKIPLRIQVMQFSDTCGNNLCESHESHETCPKECISGRLDDYCDGVKDSKCDPDCEKSKDADCQEIKTPVISEEKDKPKNYALFFLIITCYILLFIIVLSLLKIKKPKDKNSFDNKEKNNKK